MKSICNLCVEFLVSSFLVSIVLISLTGCQTQTPTPPSAQSSSPTTAATNIATSSAITPTPIPTTSGSTVTATPSSNGNKEITVYAGSSSKAALDVAGLLFLSRTGIKTYLNYGGSGTLLSQIKLTKVGDLFLPASPDYITKATADNIILPETEKRIYYLVPAIMVQKGNPKNIRSIADLAQPGMKLAIADPKTVPAGLYAYEILEYNKLITDIGRNIVVYGDSNEKISSYVMLKTVDAAIGWDIIPRQQPNNLDIVYLQPNQVPRVSYMSGAITAFSKDRESAQKFLDFLTSNEGQAVFKQNGYYTTEEEAKKFAPGAQIGGEYRLPTDYKPLVK